MKGMEMNTDWIIADLEVYNEHEQFYKEYHDRQQDPAAFRTFLNSLDRRQIKDHEFIVPELDIRTVQTGAPFEDAQYFNVDSDRSVRLQKHNRYTPPFVHTHSFFELIYVLRGTCTHNVSGRSYEMQQGDICLLSPSVVHSIYAEDSLVINILVRRTNMEDIYFNVLRDKNVISDFLINSIYLENYATYLTFHTAGDDEVLEQILEMYLEQMADDSYSNRIVSSMLIIFFTKLARKYKKAAESPSPLERDASAAKLLHTITNEYDTITLGELANRLGYSVPYCSKYIKEVTGYSFQYLLRHVRFQKAETYLLTTNMSVQRISELLGYENPENFMRAFKKEYHISPSSFRSQHEDAFTDRA